MLPIFCSSLSCRNSFQFKCEPDRRRLKMLCCSFSSNYGITLRLPLGVCYVCVSGIAWVLLTVAEHPSPSTPPSKFTNFIPNALTYILTMRRLVLGKNLLLCWRESRQQMLFRSNRIYLKVSIRH